MATSSITKEFTINDIETYEKFMKLQEEPIDETPRKVSTRLDEGLKANMMNEDYFI